WRLWPGFGNWKGDHARISSVRSVEAANSSSEVVVSQADSLVGGGVSLDRLDRLLHKHHYEKFCCCFVASVDPFRVAADNNAKNSAAVSSPPLTLFALLSAATFLLMLVLLWRHNQSAYKRRYSLRQRSFICQRCGTLTEGRLCTKVV